MFDNISEFKQEFTPFLKAFDIKPVLTSVKKPQYNAPVERVHKVMLNMLITKDIDNKVFEYIYQWGETLEYIVWNISASYHRNIMDTPGQAVFGRDMLFNLVSVVDWQVVTAAKEHQVDIDNVRENTRQVTHVYAIGDQVYVEMTGIYRILDYKRQGSYIITEVFTNGTVKLQRVKVNEKIYIRRLKPHFDE